MINGVPSFMEIFQAAIDLNSIPRARLNFWRQPILCTTLCRNPIQASNFGGTFDQLFPWIFLWGFHRRCLSTSSVPWCKKVKNNQQLKSGGGGGSCLKSGDSFWIQKKTGESMFYMYILSKKDGLSKLKTIELEIRNWYFDIHEFVLA